MRTDSSFLPDLQIIHFTIYAFLSYNVAFIKRGYYSTKAIIFGLKLKIKFVLKDKMFKTALQFYLRANRSASVIFWDN